MKNFSKFMAGYLLMSFSHVFAQQDPGQNYVQELKAVVAEIMTGSVQVNQLSCPLLKYNFKNTTKIDQENEGRQIAVNCNDINPFASILSALDATYGSQFKTNSNNAHDLSFVLAEKYNNAFYYGGLEIMFIPKYLTLSGGLRNPEFLLPVVAHEYGHYLIKHNFPIFNKEENNTFIYNAANEMLADAFSVVYYGKGDVILKGLKDTKFIQQSKDMKEVIFARDFTDQKNQLSSILPMLRNGGKVGRAAFLENDHNYLTPVRVHIWNKYISNPEVSKVYSKAVLVRFFIEQTINAIELMKNYHAAGKWFAGGDVGEFEGINQTIMNYMDKAFANGEMNRIANRKTNGNMTSRSSVFQNSRIGN